MKFCILLCFLTAVAAFPQEVKFDGYGAAGFRYINRIRIIEYNQETYYEGKFQAEMKINKHIEAQLDFRGNSDEQRVELREFSAEFSYLKYLKFELGNLKKPFGSEYVQSEEDLTAISRSFLTEAAGEIGYGGRSVGIMAYYETEDKKEFPHSYFLYIFKNNNLQNGIVARYIHHWEDIRLGGNYFLLNTGGDYTILSHGFASNIRYKKKDYTFEAELMYLQDPVEGIRRQVLEMEDIVYAWGGRLFSAIEFDTDGDIIEEIEPFALFSYYQPDTDKIKQHTFQTLMGVNFYFDKDVRLRFNADAYFTRNEYSSRYSTYDSRIVIELQVKY